MHIVDVTIRDYKGKYTEFHVELVDEKPGLAIQVSGDIDDSPRLYKLVSGGCKKCSHPGVSSDSNECWTCRSWRTLQRCIAMGEYIHGGQSPLSEDILAAKRGGERWAESIGVALGFFTKTFHEELISHDFVVPPPWHKGSEVEYRHERLIVQAFSQVTGMSYREDLLCKTSSERMVGRKLPGRVALAEESIRSTDVKLDGSSILLIDDILTSGTTLDRCATELHRIGAKVAIGLVASRTGSRN